MSFNFTLFNKILYDLDIITLKLHLFDIHKLQ